jgi:hypothetical protein
VVGLPGGFEPGRAARRAQRRREALALGAAPALREDPVDLLQVLLLRGCDARLLGGARGASLLAASAAALAAPAVELGERLLLAVEEARAVVVAAHGAAACSARARSRLRAATSLPQSSATALSNSRIASARRPSAA